MNYHVVECAAGAVPDITGYRAVKNWQLQFNDYLPPCNIYFEEGSNTQVLYKTIRAPRHPVDQLLRDQLNETVLNMRDLRVLFNGPNTEILPRVHNFQLVRQTPDWKEYGLLIDGLVPVKDPISGFMSLAEYIKMERRVPLSELDLLRVFKRLLQATLAMNQQEGYLFNFNPSTLLYNPSTMGFRIADTYTGLLGVHDRTLRMPGQIRINRKQLSPCTEMDFNTPIGMLQSFSLGTVLYYLRYRRGPLQDEMGNFLPNLRAERKIQYPWIVNDTLHFLLTGMLHQRLNQRVSVRDAHAFLDDYISGEMCVKDFSIYPTRSPPSFEARREFNNYIAHCHAMGFNQSW